MGFGPTKGRSCPGRLRTGLPARVFGSEAVLECVSPADGRGKNTAASPAVPRPGSPPPAPEPGAGFEDWSCFSQGIHSACSEGLFKNSILSCNGIFWMMLFLLFYQLSN